VAVKAALQRLVNEDVLTEPECKIEAAETVADVWGRGVMSFEYSFPAGLDTERRLPELEASFNQAPYHFWSSTIGGVTKVVSEHGYTMLEWDLFQMFFESK